MARLKTALTCLGPYGTLGFMTPDELAAGLGVSGKTIRAWLRENYRRPKNDSHTKWTLDERQIVAARGRFGTRTRRAASRDGMVTTTLALPEAQHRRLARAAENSRAAMNQVVRDAVQMWLDRKHPEPETRPHVRLLQLSQSTSTFQSRYCPRKNVRSSFTFTFSAAAEELSKEGGEGHRYPVPQYLAGHAIELALKAHLAHCGLDERARRKLDHDLVAAFERARPDVQERLDRSHIAAIEALNPYYSGKQLEYPAESDEWRTAPPFVLLHGAAECLIIYLDRVFREETNGSQR